MRLAYGVPLLLAATACGERTVEVSGTVLENRFDGADVLVDGSVTVLGPTGEVYSQTTTDSSGEFEALAPAGETVYALVGGEGLATASFVGTTGVRDSLAIEQGTLYGFEADELAEWEERFAGCAGVGEGGGVVLGEIRVWDLVDDDGQSPLVTTGYAVVQTVEGETYEACFLDDEGVAWDPDASRSGETGVFALFGVPEGVHDMLIGYDVYEGVDYVRYLPVYVPEAGLAPHFPAWVEFAY